MKQTTEYLSSEETANSARDAEVGVTLRGSGLGTLNQTLSIFKLGSLGWLVNYFCDAAKSCLHVLQSTQVFSDNRVTKIANSCCWQVNLTNPQLIHYLVVTRAPFSKTVLIHRRRFERLSFSKVRMSSFAFNRLERRRSFPGETPDNLAQCGS